MPANEMDRLLKLAEYDLDYTDARESLSGLSKLAAKVAGTSISLINLVDAFTQWTISNHGMLAEQMSRDESVCQYTIVTEESFEVKDLTADERFSQRDYVTGEPKVKYYFGVPLQTADGYNIGALCVMDQVGKEISPEKAELLKLIANEVVSRLAGFQMVQKLKYSVQEASDNQRKVAHDIRGPLGGIISLSHIITSQGDRNNIDDVLTFVNMIEKSGQSLLELADEILGKKRIAIPGQLSPDECNLQVLKDKLDKLYTPQAIAKNIRFSVALVNGNETHPVAKNKLLQIAGNLVSNAIKFTPQNGTVTVKLELIIERERKILKIVVKDSGAGLDQESIDRITSNEVVSTIGTGGEKGYGFGLSLVQHLVKEMGGNFTIESEPGAGAEFTVLLPQK